MENLPHEVLSDIFIRLLAKQLAQMRCVYKPWNALLTESSFVKSHLNRSIQTKNSDDILMFFGLFFSFEHSRTPFTLRLSRSPHLKLDNFIKLPVISKCEGGYGVLIGSMNGLICFCDGSYDDDHVMYIWNPSLSSVLTLPPSSLPSTRKLFVLGFGYDSKTDDYKVLRIVASDVGPQTEVYNMRKGAWKLISQNFPPLIKLCRGRTQACVDGHLLWHGVTDSEPKQLIIVGFDLGAETYFVMPLPETILDFKVYKCSYVLGVLGGKLCVMSCVRGGECEVWVMDEYGVADSWVKHHAFPPFTSN